MHENSLNCSTHPDVADTPPPQRDRKTSRCAEEPASCAWMPSRCAGAPLRVLETPSRYPWEPPDVYAAPRCTKDPSRCAGDPPQDVRGCCQVCLGGPRCARDCSRCARDPSRLARAPSAVPVAPASEVPGHTQMCQGTPRCAQNRGGWGGVSEQPPGSRWGGSRFPCVTQFPHHDWLGWDKDPQDRSPGDHVAMVGDGGSRGPHGPASLNLPTPSQQEPSGSNSLQDAKRRVTMGRGDNDPGHNLPPKPHQR